MKLTNLTRSPDVINVPGVGALHLGPKGSASATSAPFEVGPAGLGPEVDHRLATKPPRLAVVSQ